MQVSGYIRHIDDLGRLVIPREFRERLNIKSGQPMEMVIIDGLIIIGKVEESEGPENDR
jgi:AbrB family looped-hinge helix DNA binding protein